MPNRDIILVGASAGGVDALLGLARSLPADLPAALFVTLHVMAQARSILPDLLDGAGKLRALHPANGASIEPGHIYVAPPDHHLIVRRGVIHLGRGPAENRHRPAVDPMFRSAATAYGPRCIGVVLTGALDDGTAGLLAIKAAGGVTVVQDPSEALYPSMPFNAMQNVEIDHITTLPKLRNLLVSLAGQPISPDEDASMPAKLTHYDQDVTLAEQGAHLADDLAKRGVPSSYACPDCHGVLWELREGELLRFRCRVGHAYSPQSLAAAQSDRLEDALWTALRAFKESAALAVRLAAIARDQRLPGVARHHDRCAREAHARAVAIEEVLERGQLDLVVPEEIHKAELDRDTDGGEPSTDTEPTG